MRVAARCLEPRHANVTEPAIRRLYWRATILLTLALTGLVSAYWLVSAGPRHVRESAWFLVLQLPGAAALLLPFGAFGGGAAVGHRTSVWREAARGLWSALALLMLTTYVLSAYAEPIADQARRTRSLPAAAAVDSLGAWTPGVLLRLRDRAERQPVHSYSYSANPPLTYPPNWLTFGLHLPLAQALFGFLNSVIGFLVGRLTLGLPPPSRLNMRWAIGLATGLVFFLVQALALQWVRASHTVSAVAAAWSPLLLPAVEILLMMLLLRRRQRPLRARPPSDV